MLKIRITFIDNLEGRKEAVRAIEELKDKYTVLNESRIYKGRGGSKYSNIYLDVENKRVYIVTDKANFEVKYRS